MKNLDNRNNLPDDDEESYAEWIEDAVASAPFMPVDVYMKRIIRNGIKKG